MTNIKTIAHAAFAEFGIATTRKLAGPGEPEAQLRSPLESLLGTLGRALGRAVVMHDEDYLSDLGARPDWSVHCDGALTGHLELKAPGKGADTSTYKGHDRAQWEKLRALPNVLYTDGNQWAVYRSGELAGEIAYVEGDVRTSGADLKPADDGLAAVLSDFFSWQPVPPRSAKQLASTTAQLCRLLRNEISDALGDSSTMRAVADDWRDLLFPDATDAEFADGYAQTVTFALLLARSQGVDFDGRGIPSISNDLGSQHSLMGRALAVLTDPSLFKNLATSLNTMQRVIGAVDWQTLRKTNHADGPGGTESEWLHFYEHFLSIYDQELRQQTGSYYTPNEVVRFMVKLTDDLVRVRLKKKRGLANRNATIIDPACGTGTYLLQIIDHIADQAEQDEGVGTVEPVLRDLPSRLIGFEKQIGPFAVAQLRVHELIRAEVESRTGQMALDVPLDNSRLYVADTLDDPFADEVRLGGLYEPIAKSRRDANKIKRDQDVLVAIGNPPYKDKAGGKGGWVERGRGDGKKPLMDDFVPPANWGVGSHTKHLKNLNTYFWRWALWKVFEAHEDSPAGVVAFITTKAFVDGPGFAAMRRHLRKVADDVLVVDVSPEGHRPPVNTRVFPGVQQPLAITFVVRHSAPNPQTPARVRYVSVEGLRAEKYEQLQGLKLRSPDWQDCPTDWTSPLLPVASDWESMPSTSDLMPWNVSGIMPGRTWVYAPEPAVLARRWEHLTAIRLDQEIDDDERSRRKTLKRELFREHRRDRPISKVLRDNLPGYPATATPIGEETGACPDPIQISFRTLDRQWIIPDKRLINQPNPSLWATQSSKQIYLTTKSDGAAKAGPPLTVAGKLPDLHHHRNRGGRAHPLWRDQGATMANVAPGLCKFWADRLGNNVEPEDVAAYIVGVVSHRGYTEIFKADMAGGTTEPRVPLTTDAALWDEAVKLGRQVVWIQTYAERYVSEIEGRGPEPFQMPDDRRPRVTSAIPHTTNDMPGEISWEPDASDPETGTLCLGPGRIYPVSRSVWEYDIDDYFLVRRWFSYRAKTPGGKRDSPLDHIVAETWPSAWTTELLELLNALERIVELGEQQKNLLERMLEDPERLVSVAELAQAAILPVEDHVASAIVSSEPSMIPDV